MILMSRIEVKGRSLWWHRGGDLIDNMVVWKKKMKVSISEKLRKQ